MLDIDMYVAFIALCFAYLDINSLDQSLVVLMFFVPYVIFQPPMTVITRKLGPTYFLGSIIVAWAAIMVVRFLACHEILTLMVK